MEVNGEISDTDSGIILHSGSDSPTTHTKDVTTHTRAMKLKHQDLQDRLEICLLELKKLCIREAELTGRLSADYPLLPGEKPPQIHRRIGAAFKLDAQSIPRAAEESQLSLVDAELALQMKIYEAARKLCEEDHQSKAVRKSRLQQCKREEKKLKQLQETAFQLRLEHGRSSPLPAFNITQHDLGTSDDSSLSDSVVQDEEVMSQSSQPSSGLPYSAETDAPPPPPLVPVSSLSSSLDTSYVSPPPVAPPTPSQSPHPSLDSSEAFEAPPIQHSPWTESSLDQPYQKSKKSRSSSKMSPAKSELLPPLEACLAQSALPVQLSHLRLSRAQSSSTPSTPEMRVHRQLSLRLSNPESPHERDRGRSRGPRRRLTEYTVTVPETLPPPPPPPPPPALTYGSCHASSEDSNSEHSFSSYNSSPCQEFPCDSPRQYPQSPLLLSSLAGSYAPRPSHAAASTTPPDTSPVPLLIKPTSMPCTADQMWRQRRATTRRRLRVRPPGTSTATKTLRFLTTEHRGRYLLMSDSCMAGCVGPASLRLQRRPRQVVNEHLKSWHRRSQLKPPRSHSLDRQGAVRVKNMAARESPCFQNQQVFQRRAVQRAADEPQGHWVVDDGSHYMSQL
ncbi:hypothetical protein INR49_009339 [Caranx melampygus]|nr:hypothetical protein INR49_009339 [Caranx melampygus]